MKSKINLSEGGVLKPTSKKWKRLTKQMKASRTKWMETPNPLLKSTAPSEISPAGLLHNNYMRVHEVMSETLQLACELASIAKISGFHTFKVTKSGREWKVLIERLEIKTKGKMSRK